MNKKFAQIQNGVCPECNKRMDESGYCAECHLIPALDPEYQEWVTKQEVYFLWSSGDAGEVGIWQGEQMLASMDSLWAAGYSVDYLLGCNEQDLLKAANYSVDLLTNRLSKEDKEYLTAARERFHN